MKKIETEKAPAAIGPYSQGIVSGDHVFLSGQVAIDPESGRIDAVDVVGQTKQVMENIRQVLASAGLGLGDVVKATIFMTDISDFKSINGAYEGCFSGGVFPARSAVAVAALPRGAKVEIEVVAEIPSGQKRP